MNCKCRLYPPLAAGHIYIWIINWVCYVKETPHPPDERNIRHIRWRWRRRHWKILFRWRFNWCFDAPPWDAMGEFFWGFFSAKSPWDKTIQKRDFCIAQKFLQSIPTSHLSYLSYQYLSYVIRHSPSWSVIRKATCFMCDPQTSFGSFGQRGQQCVKLRKIHNFSFAQVEDVRGLGSMWHGHIRRIRQSWMVPDDWGIHGHFFWIWKSEEMWIDVNSIE